MKGHIDRDGWVTIKFNSTTEKLAAPGEGKIYLPCNGCGKIMEVDKSIVATMCPECYEISQQTTFECQEGMF